MSLDSSRHPASTPSASRPGGAGRLLIGCLVAASSCAEPTPQQTPPDEAVGSAGAATAAAPPTAVATTCEAAMEQVRELRGKVPSACAARAECGFADIAYDACEDPAVVNVARLDPAQRDGLVAAVGRARELCGYVQAPCPAPPVGEPVCLRGQCDTTFRVLGRSPSLALQLRTAEGPVANTMLSFTVRSGSPAGPATHTVVSDASGGVSLPAEWLGEPGSSFSLGFGRNLAQFANLSDLIEASAAPVVFERAP